MVDAFTRAAQEQGQATLPPTGANGNASQQDSDIRNLVTAGARSLLVVPADARAVVPPIDFARQRGLPVATLFLGPKGGKADVALVADNISVGQQACEFLAEKVGPTGTVLEIQGDMRQSTAQDRSTGFQQCMKSQYPGLTVLTKDGGQWDPNTAASSAAAVLASTPDLGGIFMASDGYVPSVSQTIANAGRQTPRDADGHIFTVAVDGTPTGLDAIRQGTLDADLTQPVDQFVTHGLEYVALLAKGGEITEGPTDHGSVVVMTEDGYPADQFPSVLVTEENVVDASLWANAL